MEFIYRSLDAYYDVFTYLIMLLMENPLPEPNISLLSVMRLFPLFFISAFGEEGGLVGICNRSNAKTMGCTRGELNHGISVGSMASPVHWLGIYFMPWPILVSFHF